MALGFDSAPYVQSALRTGEDFQRSLVSGIETLGKQVRQDIQRIQATRELRAFGEEMVNVDPASPDFEQQLLGAAMRHPVVLEDKRGIAAINMLGAASKRAQLSSEQNSFQQVPGFPGMRFNRGTGEVGGTPLTRPTQYRSAPGGRGFYNPENPRDFIPAPPLPSNPSGGDTPLSPSQQNARVNLFQTRQNQKVRELEKVQTEIAESPNIWEDGGNYYKATAEQVQQFERLGGAEPKSEYRTKISKQEYDRIRSKHERLGMLQKEVEDLENSVQTMLQALSNPAPTTPETLMQQDQGNQGVKNWVRRDGKLIAE